MTIVKKPIENPDSSHPFSVRESGMIYDQTVRFLLSVGLGFVLGLGYEVFRFLRLSFPHGKGVVFIEDILFALLAATATFFFFIRFTDGLFRTYVLFGEGIGFLLYLMTLGSLLRRLSRWIIGGITFLVLGFYRKVLRPVGKGFRYIAVKCASPFGKAIQKWKKREKASKNRLKKRTPLLYNKKKVIHRKTGGSFDETEISEDDRHY